MSDDSPLFVSSIELLAHATELYTQGNERKYKFVILHLANAIELILKDRLIDKGESIYVPKKSLTIIIWDSFDKLQKVGITVPERPIIELLVDDRNTIQHRFGFPDSETVFFYLKHVVAFFVRFLNEEYGVELLDTLKPYLELEDLAVLGLTRDEDEIVQLDNLYKLSPESAVIQAYNLVEARFLEVLKIDPDLQKRPYIFWRAKEFPHILDELAIGGYISHETVREFNFLREVRNRSAHMAHFQDDPSPDWARALEIAKDLIQGLDRAINEKYFDNHTVPPDSENDEKDTDGEDVS